MPLQAPKLDDRHFQDIVDEAKKRIPHYIKEWTDHNVSDPGVTMIELFAWMTDIILYRLNQVPELHTIKFMEMMGVTLQEPIPAKAPVTFWLSAPQETAVVIPQGTEVASTQTETEPSIVFTTDADFRIEIPQMAAVLSRITNQASGNKELTRKQNLNSLRVGFTGFDVFSREPQVNDALYFGFENDLSHHLLGFDLDCDPAGGAGVNPNMPPYVWEASTGNSEQRWANCDVDMDTTKSLNAGGRIRIHLPKMGRWSIRKGGDNLYWVRVRVRRVSSREANEGMSDYEQSPRIRRVTAVAWGGTITTTHAQEIKREYLGQSDGSAGQRYQLQVTPILKRRPYETVVVKEEGKETEAWTEVKDFSRSHSRSKHYTLDNASGEIRFGPAIRQPDGTIKLYGEIPPRGTNLQFRSYRYGGGQDGNVQKGVLNTLKTAIPYIDRVSNRQDAWGGLDQETLEAAMMRMPALLHARERAVTESDFEFLARQALPSEIARVKCLQPRPSKPGRVNPGLVYVLVIPRVPHPEGFIAPEQLQLNEQAKNQLIAYLDERRLLTTRLEVPDPAYRWVAVNVQLRAAPDAVQAVVEERALNRLYHFLNPLTGGPNGDGWPFGRELYPADVYQCLQGMPDVHSIRNIDFYLATEGGEAQGDTVESVEVVDHGVIVSGIHQIEFI